MFCIHCEVEFNPKSQRKRKVGGRINECADCVEDLGTETAVKYLGCASADGKMGGVSILAFESNEDREKYRKAWNKNTGLNKGKSCHLSGCQTNIGGRPMRHVNYVGANGNHKGKA